MTKKKVIEKLNDLGVEFNPRKTKKELEDLLFNVKKIEEEERVEEVEKELEELDLDEFEVEEETIEEEEVESNDPVIAKEKQDTYAGKKVLSRKKVKINGIERETVLLESLENIII